MVYGASKNEVWLGFKNFGKCQRQLLSFLSLGFGSTWSVVLLSWGVGLRYSVGIVHIVDGGDVAPLRLSPET